jgi:hypothetical protein
VARSRLPINEQEELDFLKEIISATKLKDLGSSVTLIPRIKRLDGKGFLPGPDAIVNGSFFEFKTVTGKINKVGRRFAESRIQGNNVYIRVENPRHTKAGVVFEEIKSGGILRSPLGFPMLQGRLGTWHYIKYHTRDKKSQAFFRRRSDSHPLNLNRARLRANSNSEFKKDDTREPIKRVLFQVCLPSRI